MAAKRSRKTQGSGKANAKRRRVSSQNKKVDHSRASTSTEAKPTGQQIYVAIRTVEQRDRELQDGEGDVITGTEQDPNDFTLHVDESSSSIGSVSNLSPLSDSHLIMVPCNSPGYWRHKSSDWDTFHEKGVLTKTIAKTLHKHAVTLNFMARAAMAGIDVSSFEALAAVSAEQWDSLPGAPEDAPEIVAQALLALSVEEIHDLDAGTFNLREELKELGIHI